MGNNFCCACSPCEEQNQITTITMPEVQNMEHVNALIAYIDLLTSKIQTGNQQQVVRPVSVAASIDSGRNLIEKLSRPLNSHVSKKCLLSAIHRQTRNVVIDALKQAQHIQCVGIGLSIVAHLLERAEQRFNNDDKRVHLLSYMSSLAKRMKDLDIYLDRPKLDHILSFIVNGTLVCTLQMERNPLCSFISTPVDDDDLKNLESQLLHLYPDLQLQALNELLNRQQEVLNMQQEALNRGQEVLNMQQETLDRLPVVPGPSQGEYPHDAVGIEAAKNEIIKLLDLQDESRRVVVIYGFGGIGKTTLANAVYRCLSLTRYHHCRVSIDQDSNERDLPPKQKQILHDLFGEKLELNDCIQGQEKLSEAFRRASKPVFLYVDNALRQRDLEKLLPIEHLSLLPLQSRILVTTRSLQETNMLKKGIQVYSHRVDSLPELEAKKALCHYALGDKNGSFFPGINMEGFLQFCGGIPLILRIVGSLLRSDGNTVSDCNNILQYLKEWQEQGFQGGSEDLSERVVDFVYGRLKENSKEAFLDIASFFDNWPRSRVSEIFGEMVLRDLEGAALVTTYTYEEEWERNVRVRMHDIVRARGRKLCEGNRVKDKESWSIVMNDPQKLQQTKGIWLEDTDDMNLEVEHLDLTSTSLRVLLLGEHVRINGRCQKTFAHLRFLHICCQDILAIDISKSRQLVYFQGSLISEAKFTISLPESLQVLNLVARSSPSSKIPVKFNIYGQPVGLSFGRSCSPVWLDIYGHFTSLRELQLSNIIFDNFESSVRLGNFSRLKKLLYACSELKILPESFGNLYSLCKN